MEAGDRRCKIMSVLCFTALPVGGRREVHVPEDGDDVGEEHPELEGHEGEVDGVGQGPELVVGLLVVCVGEV